MSIGKRSDPYTGMRFHVEIRGLFVGGFSEVTGLQVETETEEFREGGVNHMVHRFPKVSKPSNVTLKRGITDSDVLWKWHREIVNGNVTRRGGRIILLDANGDEARYWMFEGAFPVKWVGPDFKADGNAAAVETIELVHEGLKCGC